MGEAFFPKCLFSTLGLKLTASASPAFLEALGIERDFSNVDDDDDDDEDEDNDSDDKAFLTRYFITVLSCPLFVLQRAGPSV